MGDQTAARSDENQVTMLLINPSESEALASKAAAIVAALEELSSLTDAEAARASLAQVTQEVNLLQQNLEGLRQRLSQSVRRQLDP